VHCALLGSDDHQLGDSCTCGHEHAHELQQVLQEHALHNNHDLDVNGMVFEDQYQDNRMYFSTDYEDALAREVHSRSAFLSQKAMRTAVDIQMVQLWNKYTPSSFEQSNECTNVLIKAFASAGFDIATRQLEDSEPKLAHVLERIQESSNYEIIDVSRIEHTPRYQMWKHFAECFQIRKHVTVYHGTSAAGANCIATSGFRGAASQRSKFGKGIYTATNVWEALAYAEPENMCGTEFTQTFIVVDLLQGPTVCIFDSMYIAHV
jgi:hypothetical protein